MSNFVLVIAQNMFVFWTVLVQVSGFNYCFLNCNDTIHTMCEYPAGGGEDCLNNEKVFLTVKDKRFILEFHNNMREKVAKGSELRGVGNLKQPSAGNMMKLVWDGEIGMFAKRWADQCNKPLHDSCRKTMDGTLVGQNVYIGKFKKSNSINMRKTMEKVYRLEYALKTWYNEVDNMDANNVGKFMPDMVDTVGNYTQIVWGDTIYIGCGYTEFNMGGDDILYRFVCDYKRSGNFLYEEVYRQEEPCSSCPPRSNCSVTWGTLCWNGALHDFVDDNRAYLHESSFLIILVFNINMLLCCLQNRLYL